MSMLPMEYFRRVVIPSTSAALMMKAKREVLEPEFMRYIALWFAMTYVSAETRHDYWAKNDDDFIPAPDFGKYGISRDRFEDITSCLRFVTAAPATDSLGAVRGLIHAFNANMVASFRPSWCIVVDESMARWTNKNTIPNYVFIPRKPTPHGQEWHTLADSATHIIIAIDPVEQAPNRRFESYGKMAGTVLRLCESAGVFGTPRVLVGDSAFPTVTLVRALREKSIFSIFAIKKKGSWNKHTYPERLFNQVQNAELGDVHAQSRKAPDGTEFYIAGLRDMNPCLVMANTGTTTREGTAVSRYTRLQNGLTVQRTFVRPDVFETFYSARHAIDDNNNLRQNARSLEDVWQTKEWAHRTFAMILGMCEANAFRVYQYFVDQNLSHFKFRKSFVTTILGSAARSTPRNHGHVKTSYKSTDRVFSATLNQASVQKYPQKFCVNCVRKKTSFYCSCNIMRSMCSTCYEAHLESVEV
jgi:hypothetical protein